jgi:excisionase family DNA binding protein
MKVHTDDSVRATLRIPEAAKIAGTGTRAIRKGVAAGDIPHLKFGKNILIPRAAFMRWLDSAGDSRASAPATILARVTEGAA